MTFNEEITAMRARIAKAEAERDTWRTSGNQEKYLESYSAVEALDLQLEGLRQQGLRNMARAEAGAPAGELPIRYNGPRYRYDRYRHDQVDDAVDSARPQSSLAPGKGADIAADMLLPQEIHKPDETDPDLMAALGITFQDGVYHLGEYRYDRLVDAVNYARLRRLHGRAHPQASS